MAEGKLGGYFPDVSTLTYPADTSYECVTRDLWVQIWLVVVDQVSSDLCYYNEEVF